MKELLVATKNQGKLSQMREFLAEVPVVVRSLAEFDFDDSDFEEDGLTFEENAFKKAKYYGEMLGAEIVLAEDSGIFVEALPGELGVFTRRWGAGAEASDEEWMAVFMERMAGVEDRRARFVANVCLWIDGEGTSEKGDLLRQGRRSLLTVSDHTSASVAPSFLASHPFSEVPKGPEVYHFEKENHGVITMEVDYPLEKGIPLSSCFLPNGHQKVYARFSPEERLVVSHRGQAMAEAREMLKKVICAS